MQELRPDIRVVLATGFGGTWEPATEGASCIRQKILKPISPDALYAAMHQALQAN